MNRDERATELLLGSWYDWIPSVKTQTGGIVARSSLAGEAATAEQRCPVCGGDGEKRIRGIPQLCPRCQGRGRLLVDAYTRREIAEGFDLDDPAGLVESIKAELALESELSAPESGTAGTQRAIRKRRQDALVMQFSAGDEVDFVQDAHARLVRALEERDRLYEAGDYGPLTALMARRRLDDKPAHDALIVVYVHGTFDAAFRTIGEKLQARALNELLLLATDLRSGLGRAIRVPAWIRARSDELEQRRRRDLHRGRAPAHERARKQRNALVRAMAESGKETLEIAVRTGLTPRRVRQIVASSRASGAVDARAGGGLTFRL